MGHALRYRDVSELPESIRKRLAERFAPKRGSLSAEGITKRARKQRRDLEHNEQVVLINRINALAANDARFVVAAKRTHATPNGGPQRGMNGRRKAEGAKRGVPDLFTSYPSRECHGLYIEMKVEGGSTSKEQREWIADSLALGYAAHVCWSADEAFNLWRAYVEASFQS